MATTRAFAELVLEIVGRNQQDFQVDRRVVLLASQVIILGLLNEKLANGGALPGNYFKPYKMKVKYDSEREKKYVEFIPSFMDVGNNSGLNYVGAGQDETHINSSYIILSPGQISQYAGLEAQRMGGRPAVAPEGNVRGYLYNEPLLLDEVFVRMIPEISKLEDDDEMYGLDLKPDDYTEEPGYVLDKTIKLILVKRGFFEDKLTDNQDTK